MKSKKVDYIVSDSEHVKMQIYDGDMPPDAYHEEMAKAGYMSAKKSWDLLVGQRDAHEVQIRTLIHILRKTTQACLYSWGALFLSIIVLLVNVATWMS